MTRTSTTTSATSEFHQKHDLCQLYLSFLLQLLRVRQQSVLLRLLIVAARRQHILTRLISRVLLYLNSVSQLPLPIETDTWTMSVFWTQTRQTLRCLSTAVLRTGLLSDGRCYVLQDVQDQRGISQHLHLARQVHIAIMMGVKVQLTSCDKYSP